MSRVSDILVFLRGVLKTWLADSQAMITGAGFSLLRGIYTFGQEEHLQL